MPYGCNFGRRGGSYSGCNLKCPMLNICDTCMPASKSTYLGISLEKKILEREVCGWVYVILKFFFKTDIFGKFWQTISMSCSCFPYPLPPMDGASYSPPVLCECLLLLLLWFSFIPLLLFSLLCVCLSFRIKTDKNREKSSRPSEALQAKAKSEVPVNHSCWGCPLWERSSEREK